MNVLVDAHNIDHACLRESTQPLHKLQPILWTCPAAKRHLEFLSGAHRLLATEEYYNELVAKKEEFERQLAVHEKEMGDRPQKEFMEDGSLGDRIETALRARIAERAEAAEEARLWTLKLYDEGECVKWLKTGHVLMRVLRQDSEQYQAPVAVGVQRGSPDEGR